MKSVILCPGKKVFLPSALALSITAIFPPSTLAQTSIDKTLAPVVVTATRTAQRATDLLSDSIVITSEEIVQSGHLTLLNLLQSKRGIEVTRNGGPGTSSQVFIRGSDNKQNVVLIDGIRTNSATSGGATWAAIPLSQIDHIEIVYGPLSTFYGADAVGGVIQVFTKKGDGDPHVTASAGYGRYGTQAYESSVSGSTNGDHRIRYSLNAGHENSNGFSSARQGLSSFNRDNDGYKKDSASGQLSLELAKGHEIGLTFLQSRLDSQFDSGVSSYNARGISKLNSYAVYSKNQFLPNWISQLQLSQGADKSDSLSSTGLSRFNTTQDEFSWQNDLVLGPDVLQLLFDRREEKVDSTSATLNRKRTTDSIAASYLLKRGAHFSNLSIRNDDNSQYGSHTTGSLGYGYHITKALRATTSFGTSFRAPTFNELYFSGFGVATNKPERGKNAEVGLSYDDGKSQLTATYYRNRITDLLITANPCPTPGFAFGCAYNVDKAVLTGLTLSGSTRVADFTVRASLDFQDPHDETTGKDLNRRAKRHGNVGVDYGIGAVKFGAEVVFSGKRFDDAANVNRLGGYSLLNLYGSYALTKDWSLFGRWDNLLDKKYELAKNYNTPGSSLFVGVRYGFN